MVVCGSGADEEQVPAVWLREEGNVAKPSKGKKPPRVKEFE